MNIKYRQLKAFALAVEAGSFAAASERMSVTPSSFSALIKELEQDLGVELFVRTTRSCRLTESGYSFHERIRGPLEDLELSYAYVRDIGRGARGTLRLACLPSLASGMATRHLAEFQRLYPAVRIQLRERKHKELLDAVRNSTVEFGIGIMLYRDAELDFDHVLSDRLMFVVPEGHAISSMTPRWKCLESFPYIIVGHGNTEQALSAAFVRAPAAYEVEHVTTALAMVRQGLGISVLPSSILPGVNVQGLECIPIEDETAVRRIGIVRRKNRQLGATARAFVELVQREAAEAAKAAEATEATEATEAAEARR